MARASIASNPRLDWRIFIAISALIAVGFYLAMSALTYRIGFPLDDTWIHLTYARNFAEHGEWAFRLGESSAGSTAPLWTLLLSLGYYFKLAPYAWTFLLGWLILTALAIFAEASTRRLLNAYKPLLPWVGIFFAFAWHLTWSAVSGMETLLHGLIIFVVLVNLLNNSRRYLVFGLFAGLSVWVRPDGLTLLGPIVFTILFTEKDWRARSKACLMTMIGFGALFLPYLLFNLALSGNPLPNTFYAKQAEYQADWLGKAFSVRISEYSLPIVASPFVVLIPGVLMWIGRSIRERSWGTLAGVIWLIGYIAVYFIRLPPYQHGRYIIPAFPILYFFGILGMTEYVLRKESSRLIGLFWKIILAVLCSIFAVLGAQQNAKDVNWVETQMVATAEWINENLPPDAVLAVHDIGALGYFVQNPLLDMAGLVNPEVIPFIRDEARLAEYLDDNSAEYLIVLPGFYDILTALNPPIHVAGSEESGISPNGHMQVYPWR